MYLVKLLKNFFKSLIIFFTYPFTFFAIFFLSEKNIYNKIFKKYFSAGSNFKYKSLLGFIKRFSFDNNYYYYPYFLKKKYISASMGNPYEGVLTSKIYRKRGFPDKYFKTNTAYQYLIDYINDNKFEKKIIHQIGASSGREINYFSKLSKSLKFEASDLTIEIANDIQSNYPHIESFRIDLSNKKDVRKLAKRCSLIVAFGGLQYLIPKDLKIFFEICKKNKCELIISQPISNLYNPIFLNKAMPRGLLSWSHCYLKIASKLGYKYKATTSYNSNEDNQMLYAHFFS